MQKKLSVLLGVLLLALLAACGQPAPVGPTNLVLEANVVAAPTAPPAVGVGLVLVDPTAVPVAPTSVVPITPFLYRGQTAHVAGDGRTNVVFPLGEDLPPQLLAPTDRFVFVGDAGPCVTSTSAPGARATYLGLSELLLPAIFVYGLDGAVPALTTDAPLDVALTPPAVFERPWITWVYATGAADVRTAEGGCQPPSVDFVLDVDLSLAPGWNQVAMDLEWDATAGAVSAVAIRDGSATSLYVNGLP